jgi:hypothetical protein
MTIQKGFTSVDDLLSTSLENDVIVIRQKQHIKTLTRDVSAIFSFYEYIESVLSRKSCKAIVMFARPDKDEYIEYSLFLSKAPSAKDGNNLIDRLVNGQLLHPEAIDIQRYYSFRRAGNGLNVSPESQPGL